MCREPAVPVAGILWIFDRLIESAVLERLHAANHLELLIATGSSATKNRLRGFGSGGGEKMLTSFRRC